MPIDLKAVNFQPLIDLLSKAGEETTEFQKAKATSRMAQVAFWIGLLGIVAEAVAQSFGVESRVGMIAGVIVTVTGLVIKIVSSTSYTAARVETKAAAAQVATAVIAAAPSEPKA